MEADELFLGEGKPSTSEAGFSLSQTLTLSQHGLGRCPNTPLRFLVALCWVRWSTLIGVAYRTLVGVEWLTLIGVECRTPVGVD